MRRVKRAKVINPESQKDKENERNKCEGSREEMQKQQHGRVQNVSMYAKEVHLECISSKLRRFVLAFISGLTLFALLTPRINYFDSIKNA